MKRYYLADLIGEDYKKWKNRKIFLCAPTGMGKTTFILQTLLPYLQERGKKMLILCNRRMLRMQYWYALVQNFVRFSDLKNVVEVKTYQQLAEELRRQRNVENFSLEYDVICCDEAHYFYSDSDFNGFGTYVLLQAILYAGLSKQIIFMTATMTEVEPLLEQSIKQAARVLRCKYHESKNGQYAEILKYDYGYLADYSQFECYCSPDVDTLCEAISMESKKSIIFVDDKEMAKEMATKIERFGNIKSSKIRLLNAQNLDNEENNEMVKNMVMNHKLVPQVLITTSVLDNGVSIEDPEVGNVVIITESVISFLQMLGRVRAGYSDRVKLHFLQRTAKIFQKREQQYGRMVEIIEEVREKKVDLCRYDFLSVVWEDADKELANIYKKIFVCSHRDLDFFIENTNRVNVSYGNSRFTLNQFAIEKIGNQFMRESLFYSIAMNDPLNVIFKQMQNIGKDKEQLTILKSTYLESKQEELLSDLKKIKNYSLEQLKESKSSLAVKYRKELFADIVLKNGSFSTDKFKQILHKYGLELKVEKEDGGNRYFVMDGGKENDVDR